MDWAKLRCWYSDHIWISDLPLSLDGKFAVLATLWMPSATCKRCGKKYKGMNTQYAEKEKWITKTPNDTSFCRIKPY